MFVDDSASPTSAPTTTVVGAAVGVREIMTAMQVGRRAALAAIAAWAMGVGLGAQTPQPFPRGTTPGRPTSPPQPPVSPPAPAAIDPSAPTEAQLGMPLAPTAQFIASYDAGRGQRYYLFGISSPFAEVVAYYRTALKEKGTLVFEQPPTHMFEVGRFREETMAFPPGVTVKDFTWGGSTGYPNPKGSAPERFATIIQIVPAPPPANRR